LQFTSLVQNPKHKKGGKMKMQVRSLKIINLNLLKLVIALGIIALVVTGCGGSDENGNASNTANQDSRKESRTQ
jgi:hypothetical protein